MTRLLITGDWQLRTSPPANRMDDFYEVQKGKVLQVFEIAQREECDFILVPGDFFDNPSPGIRLLIDYIRLINHPWPFKILACFGQHDLYMHNPDYSTGPLSLLQHACDKVYIAGSDSSARTPWVNTPVCKLFPIDSAFVEADPGGTTMSDMARAASSGQCAFYGLSYGDPRMGKFEAWTDDLFNILLIHDMIGPEELFPGQEIDSPEQAFKAYPTFDLIVCGDYHYSFVYKEKGVLRVINAGCLVRKTVHWRDQQLRPAAYVFDTKSGSLERFELQFAPPEKVFREVERGATAEIGDDLVELMSTIDDVDLSYEDIIRAMVEQEVAGIGKSAGEVILKLLEETLDAYRAEGLRGSLPKGEAVS